ncbi:exopolysaccharide biosynthesis protein [Pseudoxanthomonas sangjuensis]|uniref:exopolysaccharide biosynthesis protein n=1 Tax=Pseudoxanthomonas sangjuensis TaxID=1503750 RepID=UPI0013920F51|nr:exopolysaccharide biosynthesis protein [Pseudoxanthomonas sangjuensis]KAF1713380.1 hypothetical protein CSC71_07710 [Pseudoxanthomonas sangjuensis]
MTPTPTDSGPRHDRRAARTSTRAVLDHLADGDPEQRLPLGELLAGLRQSAFGLLLFLGVLTAFIPIPGLAGAISGPVTMLVGLQLLFGLRRPWLPRILAARAPHRRAVVRFRNMLAGTLRWLEVLVKPRLEWVLDHRLASATTGLLLLALGALLWLPIPFTNYIFGGLLLLFAIALLERDGVLMLISWLAGAAAVLVFGTAAGSLLELGLSLLQRWL